LDMNSFFASCEQARRPELQGRPTAVVPVLAETTCCIAASREAKRWGVKTGTPVHQARQACPDIVLVKADPHHYIDVHHKLLDAVQSCVPTVKVRSIDELVYRLARDQQPTAAAVELADSVRSALRRSLGPWLTCSVGLGPNEMLAKVASDMRKPDGRTVIESERLPEALYRLKLTDFPGIGPRMHTRLVRCGVYRVEQLCRLSAAELGLVWGSRWLGSLWYHRLRGDDVPDVPTGRRTLGHSHVLPPRLRTAAGSRAVVLRLVEKAAARLRHIRCWTRNVTVAVRHPDGSGWWDKVNIPATQDTLTLIRATAAVWDRRPSAEPLKVGIVFADLTGHRFAPPSLFDEDRKWLQVSQAVDRINRLYGKAVVYFGGMHAARRAAPTRIAFTVIPDRTFSDA
jgi:DNA polymerase IV